MLAGWLVASPPASCCARGFSLDSYFTLSNYVIISLNILVSRAVSGEGARRAHANMTKTGRTEKT